MIDFSGRPGPGMTRAVQARHDRRLRRRARARVLPGLRRTTRCVTLHIDNLRGENAHHQCETVFKAFARALRMARRARPARRRHHPVDQGQPLTALASRRHARAPSRSSTTAWATCARWRRRCAHVAPAAARRASITSRPEDVRAAERVVLPGQGAMPDCMRELRESGLQEAVLRGRARPSRCSACASACRCCSSAARKGRHARPGPAPRRGRALPARRPAAARRQPLQGAAMGWNHVLPGAAARRCGRASPTAAASISCTAIYARPSDAAPQRGRNRLRRRFTCASPAIIFSRPSSTPRKAPTPACTSTATSSTGIPDRCTPAASPPVARHSTARHAADSRDRPQGRPLRAPEAGRHGPGHRSSAKTPPRWRGTGSTRARGACTWST